MFFEQLQRERFVPLAQRCKPHHVGEHDSGEASGGRHVRSMALVGLSHGPGGRLGLTVGHERPRGLRRNRFRGDQSEGI